MDTRIVATCEEERVVRLLMKEGVKDLLEFYDPYFGGEQKVKEKEKREGRKKVGFIEKKRLGTADLPTQRGRGKDKIPCFQLRPLSHNHEIKNGVALFFPASLHNLSYHAFDYQPIICRDTIT